MHDVKQSWPGDKPRERRPAAEADAGPIYGGRVHRAPSLGFMTTFHTVLEATGGNNVGIVVPESTVLAFNRGKRVPVIVTIDGGYTYKTTIGVMGGRYLVSFNAETRNDEEDVDATGDPP